MSEHQTKNGTGFWKWIASILVSGALGSMGFMCEVTWSTGQKVAAIEATMIAEIKSCHDREDVIASELEHNGQRLERVEQNQARVMQAVGIK